MCIRDSTCTESILTAVFPLTVELAIEQWPPAPMYRPPPCVCDQASTDMRHITYSYCCDGCVVCLNTALTPCKMWATTITSTAHFVIQTTTNIIIIHHAAQHTYHHNNATTITTNTGTPCIAHVVGVSVGEQNTSSYVLQHLWCDAQCALWCVCTS